MRNPGLALLDSAKTEFFLTNNFSSQTINEFTINGNPNKYIVQNETIFVLRPVHAFAFDLISSFNDFQGKNIVVGLVGHGITESHIVTHFIPARAQPQAIDQIVVPLKKMPIFALDSKGPLNDSFYQFQKPLSKKILDLLKAPFQTLFPKQISNFKAQGQDIQAISQGKQSLFDGVTCGIHNIQNILALSQMSDEDIRTSFETGNLRTTNLTNDDINKLFNNNTDDIIGFAAFVKSAWNNTFMKGKSVDEQNQQSFANYFLGWPKDGTPGQKALYFLSLSFITTPVMNTIKTLVQFPVNFISESAHVLRNRLMLLSPTALPVQFLRSIGLIATGLVENLTKGLGFVLNAVTSPIDNAKASWKTNKALGVLSGLISVAAYAGLAIFAAPAALGQLANYLPVLKTLTTFIGNINFAISGASLYTSLSAFVIAVGAGLSSLKSLVNYGLNIFSKTPAPAPAPASAPKTDPGIVSEDTFSALTGVLGHGPSQDSQASTDVLTAPTAPTAPTDSVNKSEISQATSEEPRNSFKP